MCQIYDAFTSMVLLSLEALGFCGKGEGGPFVEDGKLRVGGALPTNTDGGGLSACHPGMRGMFLMVEAVKQLRGEAGDRQVPGAADRLRQRHRRLVQLGFDAAARRRLTGAPNTPRCNIVVSTSTTVSSEKSRSLDDVKYASRSTIASIAAVASPESGRCDRVRLGQAPLQALDDLLERVEAEAHELAVDHLLLHPPPDDRAVPPVGARRTG